MPSYKPERLALARFIVAVVKEIHGLWSPDRRFGNEIDFVFVALTVGIGDFEGKPMTTSNVADYLDMPRQTTQRKLDALVRRGNVIREGNTYRIPEPQIAHLEKYVARVTRIAEKSQNKLVRPFWGF
jgi:hypothetical protein